MNESIRSSAGGRPLGSVDPITLRSVATAEGQGRGTKEGVHRQRKGRRKHVAWESSRRPVSTRDRG